MKRLLFVGESWLGSGARALKDALNRTNVLCVDEINEDSFFQKPRARWLRAVSRITTPAYLEEFDRHVIKRLEAFRPRILMVYKGTYVRAELLRHARRLGVATVNVYPDCSPHAHGVAHKMAVGEYDLVISTKPFQPARWASVYGYQNRCSFVPQGYDAGLHLVRDPPVNQDIDVVMIATQRHEYFNLVRGLAEQLPSPEIKVAVGGAGWEKVREHLPSHWIFPGELHGRLYVEWLRRGKICVAPVTRDVSIAGQIQPGDEDSTRTYELAAARCFFIHRRTDYLANVYSEETEVPVYDDAGDLARSIEFFLNNSAKRLDMATASHRRAVPAYSMDARAGEVLELINMYFGDEQMR